ncbi:MAG TPA: hypothetical protein VGK64_26940 [Bryobacteraceae bacterium]
MRKCAYAIWLAAALLASVVLAAQGEQNSPFTGTWKLNVAKSKISPGPAPKSETVTIAPDRKVSVETVDADGKTINWSYNPAENTAVPIDGMENSTVVEKLSGNTVDHTWKMGNGTETGHGVVSKNGKTMKYTLTGTNSQGQKVHGVYIFEKQ